MNMVEVQAMGTSVLAVDLKYTYLSPYYDNGNCPKHCTHKYNNVGCSR